jgi:hypothetical protein
MGLNGVDAYTGKRDPKLERDIQEFRTNLVGYAREHKDELMPTVGHVEDEYNKFVTEFADPTKDPAPYMSQIAWECAAGFYQRPIKVYAQSSTGFQTDKKGQLKSVNTFNPDGQRASIHVALYGLSYCLLIPKG